jgi:hypothetical protein
MRLSVITHEGMNDFSGHSSRNTPSSEGMYHPDMGRMGPVHSTSDFQNNQGDADDDRSAERCAAHKLFHCINVRCINVHNVVHGCPLHKRTGCCMACRRGIQFSACGMAMPLEAHPCLRGLQVSACSAAMPLVVSPAYAAGHSLARSLPFCRQGTGVAASSAPAVR